MVIFQKIETNYRIIQKITNVQNTQKLPSNGSSTRYELFITLKITESVSIRPNLRTELDLKTLNRELIFLTHN